MLGSWRRRLSGKAIRTFRVNGQAQSPDTRSAGQTSSIISIGELAIDLRARQVSRGDGPVNLTAREFGLLEYLAMHRGKVISRRELYDHLFDELDDPASNIVDVYISYLRRKLGSELIETRRGQGYVIS